MHSTNYSNTLICPAEDCRIVAKIPDKLGSVAAAQYALLADNPYSLTSDDVFLTVAAQRKGIDEKERCTFREAFFAKGQPCFRASPLTKTHGWAVHSDKDGYVAILSPNGSKFETMLLDDQIKKVNAMRNKRA